MRAILANVDGDVPQHDVDDKKHGLSDYVINKVKVNAHPVYQPIFKLRQMQFLHKHPDSPTFPTVKQPVRAHFIQLENPLKHFSFKTSALGCGKVSTVQQSAIHHKCVLATNAGFFNTRTGTCLGSLISQGEKITTSDVTNVNFGITNSGNYVVGYMSQDDIDKMDFLQLLSGVIWLVRDGKNYVQEALNIEESSTQESGTLERFVTLYASRTAIGHTADGELILLQVDGDGNTNQGLNLHEVAEKMIELGAVQAVNLDGGGSSTTVVNGEIVSSVSDGCPSSEGGNRDFRCPRRVSAITCIHNAQTLLPPEDDSATKSNDNGRTELLFNVVQKIVTTALFVGLGIVVLLIVFVVVFSLSIFILYQFIQWMDQLDRKSYAKLNQDDEMELSQYYDEERDVSDNGSEGRDLSRSDNSQNVTGEETVDVASAVNVEMTVDENPEHALGEV